MNYHHILTAPLVRFTSPTLSVPFPAAAGKTSSDKCNELYLHITAQQISKVSLGTQEDLVSKEQTVSLSIWPPTKPEIKSGFKFSSWPETLI